MTNKFNYNDKNYDQYATEIELEALESARNNGGSATKAGIELGKSRSTIKGYIKRIESKAKKSGYIPENGLTMPFDPSLIMTKPTVHVKVGKDGTGKVNQYWARLQPDELKRQEMLKAFADELKKDLPKYPTIKSPGSTNKDLANLFVITDFHLGMLAHKEETNDADWDLKKGEKLLVAWFTRAIELAPDANQAIFAQMGDFLHWDGLDAVTPASKHVLDADTRFHKLVRAAIRVIRTVINMLLSKYKKVHVLMLDANHDPASGVWLRELFSVVYEDNKRVTVDLNPNPYNCYEFGLNALFFHHGHKRRVANIDTVFAGIYREVFGRTEFAYAHTGHLHSIDMKESNLMVVEQHRTLAPADAYSARAGYMSGRDAKVITYHRKYGEVARLTISPKMV